MPNFLNMTLRNFFLKIQQYFLKKVLVSDCKLALHRFKVLDKVPKYKPMEAVNINYLYQTEELEWHHWEGLATDASLSEPVVKKKKKTGFEELSDILFNPRE